MILRFITKLDLMKILLYSLICVTLFHGLRNGMQMLFNVEKCKVMHIGYDKEMKAEYLMESNSNM